MKNYLIITASHICPEFSGSPVKTTPMITRKSGHSGQACAFGSHVVDSRLASLALRFDAVLGPMTALFYSLLHMLGLRYERADMDALDAVMAEMGGIGENARYWTRACQKFVEQGERQRAKGRVVRAPDWLIWLGRYGITISPARLREIMAALSLKGRVAVMGLARGLASSQIVQAGHIGLSHPVMPGENAYRGAQKRLLATGVWDTHVLPD